MKTLDLVQGSPEWLAHRATHFNASDAPAMMACSPYKTRSQLLHEMHTGIAPEVDSATQKRFDDGHRFEALARPLAAKIVGEELYPSVGSEGKLSASFDGLTMGEDMAFEHKTLNDQLRAALMSDDPAGSLALAYRVQMEQQMMVSGAARVLFMASKWDSNNELIEEMNCWYEPDAELRAAIMYGWAQFAVDLAAYVLPERATVVVAEPVQALPAVVVRVTGEIVIHENFDAFETAVRNFLEHRLILAPKSDQDFADLDVQIKAMKGAEAALDNAEANWIAQIAPVSTAKGRKDMLSKLVRDNRLMAEKLLSSEKERRRGEIVAGGESALTAHIAALNIRLGKPYMPTMPASFGGVVKGLKSLSSMEDKVAGELARVKIESNAIADKIQLNLAALVELASAHKFLFADVAQLVLKAPDDLRAVAVSRIGEHDKAEAARLERQREQIRAEEQAKAEAAARATLAAEAEAARVDKAREDKIAADALAADALAKAAEVVAVAAPVAEVAPVEIPPPAAARRFAGPTMIAPSKPSVRAQIDAILDRLNELDQGRVLSFVQSRFEAVAA